MLEWQSGPGPLKVMFSCYFMLFPSEALGLRPKESSLESPQNSFESKEAKESKEAT